MRLKYKNLKQLKAAYDSGELSKRNRLVLDNDAAFVYVGDDCVYRCDNPPGNEVLEQALDLLGVPWEDA